MNANNLVPNNQAPRLGGAIVAHRKQLGWTQDQMAERVGVDAEMISRFERGATVPSLATLDALALQLGVTTVAWLDQERPSPIDEAQVISSWMIKLKAKNRTSLLEMVRLYCERHG